MAPIMTIKPRPKTRMASLIDQTANVYVIGRVGYIDELGGMRSTAFCRKWDDDKGRFFAVDDPDYEHAE